MRKNWLFSLLALGLTALTVQGGCVIIPEVKTKIVELVASGTACDTLDTTGDLNMHDDFDVADLSNLDIQQILEDAGIDVSDVDSVAVFGITYKTTQPDSRSDREIVNGNVTVTRGSYNSGTQVFTPSTGAVDVITNFNVLVNSVTTDQTAPVSAGGIALLNQILNDLLNEAKGLGPASNTAIQYHVTGVSNPQGIATDFKWRICVKINIKGKVEVDVVE